MEKAMSLGKEVLNEMLNDGLYNSYSQNDSKIREIQDQ
jgi:hypothetical protein